MRREILILLLVYCSWSAALSQGSSASSSQLKLPLSARSAALGESTVSDEGQFSSWFINPATLFSNSPFAITLTHSQWMQQVQAELIGLRIPSPVGTFGIGVTSTSIPGIEIRDVPGPALGTFSARFAAFQLGYAAGLSNEIIVGASVKYLYEKLYVDEASGYGFDIGLTYRTPVDGLHAGIAVTNIGRLQQFQIERSDLPTLARAGASFLLQREDFDFTATGAWASNLVDHDSHFQTGLEATYNRQMSLRLGYQTGYESRAISAGLGIHFEFIQFDYSYVPFSLGLGDSHLFSLAFQF
jgi:hypothetical protein